MALQPVPHRFTVEEYYRMSEIGLLPPDVRTELLEGEILEMTSIGSRHAECVNRFNIAFARRLGDRAWLSVQNPVHLDDFSEPQPDLALVRLRDHGYGDGHPEPGDVLLLVEVGDTTARFDRIRKMPIYARAGIVEAWLVDLEVGLIERRLGPVEGEYPVAERFVPGDEIATAFAPDVTFEVTDFIP